LEVTKKALQSFEKLLMSSDLINLKSLNLSNSNILDSTLTVISFLGALESLCIDNCRKISDDGITRLLVSKKINRLRILSLHHTNISDEAASHLVYKQFQAATVQIESLDLSHCENLHGHFLQVFVDSPTIQNIRVLNLASTKLNDFAMEILCQTFLRSLKELN